MDSLSTSLNRDLDSFSCLLSHLTIGQWKSSLEQRSNDTFSPAMTVGWGEKSWRFLLHDLPIIALLGYCVVFHSSTFFFQSCDHFYYGSDDECVLVYGWSRSLRSTNFMLIRLFHSRPWFYSLCFYWFAWFGRKFFCDNRMIGVKIWRWLFSRFSSIRVSDNRLIVHHRTAQRYWDRASRFLHRYLSVSVLSGNLGDAIRLCYLLEWFEFSLDRFISMARSSTRDSRSNDHENRAPTTSDYELRHLFVREILPCS